ncbi:MAG: hypothetical protein KC505_04300 [Myxococcales bacterium]|nr:hypothetical protein [Myxococcales bacterium]USN50226.1 MAG: hypothetical protein H6731_08130 [Myxococcales bacterium]
MAKMIKKSIFLIVVYYLNSCSPGIDYADLAFDHNNLIDYGAQVRNKEIEPGPLSYGHLCLSAKVGGSFQIEQELEKINQSLSEIKNLPQKNTFDTSQFSKLNKFVDETENIVAKDIKPKIHDALISAASGKKFAIEMERIIKDDGVSGAIETLKKDVPQTAMNDYERLGMTLKISLEKIYQLSVFYSQLTVQKQAQEHLHQLRKSLDDLNNAVNEQVMFANEDVLNSAVLALATAKIKSSVISQMVDEISSLKLIKKELLELLSELKSSLFGFKGLKNRFVDKVDELYALPTKNIFKLIKDSFTALEVLISNYDESPKKNNDTRIKAQIEQAFSGQLSAVIEPVEVNEESDLLSFIRQLSQHRVMGLYAHDSNDDFIKSLSVAVEQGLARNYGLVSDNVYALNHVKLNDTKVSFSMSAAGWKNYLRGVSKKIVAVKSRDGYEANLFVIFADALAQGAPVNDLINIFSQGKNKVLVVAKQPQDFAIKEAYRSKGVDVASAYLVALSILNKLEPHFNGDRFAETLVKVMFAFKKTPEQFNLTSVERVLKDAYARIEKNNNPSTLAINKAIFEALGAHEHNYDLSLIRNSRAIVDSIKNLSKNIENDQMYYFKEARGLSPSLRTLESDKLYFLKKLEKQTTQNLKQKIISDQHKKIKTRIKITQAKLQEIKNDLDRDPALHPVRIEREMLINEIQNLFVLYEQLIDMSYELKINKREKFFENQENDFVRFFNKIEQICLKRDFLENLKNLQVNQMTLRNDAELYLPPEILTMLDQYPSWHPWVYFAAATKAVFQNRFNGTPANDPALIVAIDNHYAFYPEFEGIAPTMHTIRTKIIGEYERLMLFAQNIVGPHPLPANADRVLDILPVGYHVVPEPPPLKNVRFEKGSVGESYLSLEEKNLKVLIPLWDDLLDVSASIQRAAGKIFERLSEVNMF